MKKIRIYPYHFRVSAARDLVDKLEEMGANALRVYPDRNYRPKPNDLVISWGCSSAPKWKNPLNYKYQLLNSWEKVPNAINKIQSFARFKALEVSSPPATTDHYEAKLWLDSEITTIGRKQLNGRAGHGIVVMEKIEDFIECPLYTQYKKKKKEFRIHVFNGKVIDAQEKRKKKGFDGVDSKIRVCDNGWVFCRGGVVLPDDAAEQSIKAVQSLGLDFGGVDLIWNEKENKSYVLEVNSAPGIEGTTVTKYAEEIFMLAQQ